MKTIRNAYICVISNRIIMAKPPYVFNQITQWLPRDKFEWLVKKYNGNAYVKGYSCWNHLLVMIWAQLTCRRSLRDIETSLRAHSDKTYRMGIGASVSRNNISHANARRDVAMFRELAQDMMQRACGVGARDGTLAEIGRAIRAAGFFAIDSTTVSLDLRRFGWSVPQKERGGVKVHTMFDLMRKVPRMCLVTGHEERDQTFMSDYPFEPQCFYVMDKAYCKTQGLRAIDRAGAYFLVRIKRNMVFQTLRRSPAQDDRVLADETIRFTSRWASQGYPSELRLVTYYSPEKNHTFRFITNHTEIDALTLSLLYLYRWEIEQYFKWVKQQLRITSFYGYGENAVISQIYTAYITFCLLAMSAEEVKFKGTLYDFSNMVSTCLTEREWLDVIARRHERAEIVGLSYDLPTLFDGFDNIYL